MSLVDYRVQAQKCRDEADRASLSNVRDRYLRAEAAWLGMAVRYERVAEQQRARAIKTLSE